MQVALPRFGNGLSSVFNSSPVKVMPVAGRLTMSASNVKANSQTVKQSVASGKAQALADARQSNSQVVNVKA